MPAATFLAFEECLIGDCGDFNEAPIYGYVNCTEFCIGVSGLADLFFDPPVE